MIHVGSVINGKYRVVAAVGADGFGLVFEGVHVLTERRVAIKVVASTDPALARRALRGARAASRVRHPNVVDVLDFDVEAISGWPYIALEFLEGDDLALHAEDRPDGYLSVGESLRILAPVMEGLVALHRAGVVHCNLKPANLLVSTDHRGAPRPTIIGFGFARVAEAADDDVGVAGTPVYMAPEQALARPDIDPRADVWALGVILYELLTGARPFDTGEPLTTMRRVAYDEPAPLSAHDPTLPDDVVALVTRALQKGRDDRFPTMQAMLDATAACAAFA